MKIGIITDIHSNIRALNAVLEEFEKIVEFKNEMLNCEMNKIKEDLIALEKEKNELNKPKITYYDMVLKSEGLISITSIAKDYGMSGQAFNKMLHDLKVQYKQGKQWLLHSKYDNLGWTQSETYCNGDNSYLHTKWTQKGRLGLYELLKSKNILPTIEKKQQII